MALTRDELIAKAESALANAVSNAGQNVAFNMSKSEAYSSAAQGYIALLAETPETP